MVEVSLREVTSDTLRSVLELKVTPGQERFVANNAVSIAQAYFAPEAWFRAIYADETPVGFVMLSIDTEKGAYWIWRLMVGAQHQRKGYGRAGVECVIEHVRQLPGARELFLSFVPAEGNPSPFYRSLGFELTGEEEDGEKVMRLALGGD